MKDTFPFLFVNALCFAFLSVSCNLTLRKNFYSKIIIILRVKKKKKKKILLAKSVKQIINQIRILII